MSEQAPRVTPVATAAPSSVGPVKSFFLERVALPAAFIALGMGIGYFLARSKSKKASASDA